VKAVALLMHPEIKDPKAIVAYVETDPLVLSHGDYWG
jgi:hypothetical protein